MNIESARIYLSELRREVLAREKAICAIEELYGLDTRSELERNHPVPVKPDKPKQTGTNPSRSE
jgi:hypothetical protein